MRDVDKGHAWLCFIGAIGASFLNGALGYGYGIIHVALLDHFKDDVAKTAFVGSLVANLLGLLGPLASIAINLSNCRVSMLLGSSLITIGMASSFFAQNLYTILVTYGIVVGTGFGFTATTSVVILGYAFEKYRGFTVGVSVAAAGAGMFICGPMHQYLIDNYSILGAFLLLGGISSQYFVFGALMKPSGLEVWHKQFLKTKNENTGSNVLKRFLHFEIFKNVSFWCILISAIFMGLPYSLILIHLPNYSVTLGYTHDQAAFLLALIGLGSTINRLLVGVSSGDGGIDVLLLYFGSVALSGVCTVVFPLFSTSYQGQCIYAFTFGLYSGAFIALCNPLCLELVGLDQLPTGVGLYFCFLGIGGLIGPPIAGMIVDRGGTYEKSFYISGVCFIVAAVLVLLSAINRPKIPSNLNANGDTTYSIDSNMYPVSSSHYKGSGFLKGSGFFRGSGFMAAPEIFTGSGSIRGSGFFINQQTDSIPTLNGHDIVEKIPLRIETSHNS